MQFSQEHDVKVITDLMMGGDGSNTDGELGELHLSAISEAMNQMMGSNIMLLQNQNIRSIQTNRIFNLNKYAWPLFREGEE